MNPVARAFAVAVALAYAATLVSCAPPQAAPASSGLAPAMMPAGIAAGKLEISKSGTGYLVRMINPKDGAAGANSAYAKDKAGCDGHAAPCYIFSALDGTAPLPVTADSCVVDKTGSVPTAYCGAAGIASVTIDAPEGGTIGHDASGSSELGKDCFPSSVTYEVGPKRVYSVLAWDGCKETIRCAAHNVGTVDADDKDVIQGRCYFVDRH
ncbi:MAG TPA: hypothetical protein VMF61_09240 [Candidatus Acidoferrales bacterium]|nr:hypothetical protein [Candidatus Acidoferrales bacterium]